jgi:ribosomal protein S21
LKNCNLVVILYHKNKFINKSQKYHLSILPGCPVGVNVVDNDVNFALKVWKRQMKSAGVVQTLKDRREYKKKSDVRRNEIIRASYIQYHTSKRMEN